LTLALNIDARKVKPMHISVFSILAILFAAFTSAQAAVITIEVQVPRTETRRVKDLVIKVKTGKVTKVTDNEVFRTPKEGSNPNSQTVKFDGGNIASGTTNSVIIETTGSDTHWKSLKVSYTNGDTRANSKGDDINSKVVYGGASGSTFLGIPIASHEYGYFFQFERNDSFPESPAFFEVVFNSSTAPTSHGVISNTFDPALINADFGDFGSKELIVQDSMIASSLTGINGVAPADWFFDSLEHKMIARYATNAFNVNDPASILWFTHSHAPALGVVVSGSDNAFIKASDGTIIFTNSIDAPSIPEPTTYLLVATGLLGAFGSLRNRRTIPRAPVANDSI
jgi:hypothetical protein